MKKIAFWRRMVSNETSFRDDMKLFYSGESWKVNKNVPGIKMIFVLKKVLEYFPDVDIDPDACDPIKELEGIIKTIDATLSKIMLELNDTALDSEREELDGVYTLFSGEPKFAHFARSKIFVSLFKKCFEIFSYVKKYDLVKEVAGDSKERHAHADRCVVYATVFKDLMCDLFYNCLSDNVRYMEAVVDVDRVKRLNFKKIIERVSRASDFFHKLQIFFTKYSCANSQLISDAHYRERKNIFITNILQDNERYEHILCHTMAKLFPDVEKKIQTLDTQEFDEFIRKSISNIRTYLLVQDRVLTVFESLIFDHTVRGYIRHIIGFEEWESMYMCMSLHDLKNKMGFKKYPIVVRISQTLYGVVQNSTIYFGNVVYVYFKYKDLLDEKHNSEIDVWTDSSEEPRTYSFKRFL